MANIIENAFLLGLGALSISKNAAENLIKDAVKKAEITENEGDTLMQTFIKEGEKAKETIQKAVDEAIKSRGQSLMPGAAKIADLEAKVAALEARIAELEGKKA
ncbi:MAG: hypothetical protein J5746_08580 [Victivallales bacterium]|nr:hypothetical protein [Victivallales bacterium]